MKITVNGTERAVASPPTTPLLWVLRDEFGLTGTKYGCGVAASGSCTVHVDGKPRRACVTPVHTVTGARVTTIEGLSPAGDHPVQRAWREHLVPQCGFCQAGQIMQAAALLDAAPDPTDEQIDRAMSGNICRCGTYPRIRQAIKTAAKGGR
jgi:isoquinoline 1-oxidoreductase alpha subunit